MFIESSWQDSVVALLIAINGVFGDPQYTAVRRPISVPDVVTIAGSLQQRTYQAQRWFNQGIASQPVVTSAMPPLNAAQRYEAILLPVEPSGRERLSSRAGGLLYEDPFYALLAAYNIGAQAPSTRGWTVEVRVSSRQQAWQRRQSIIDALRVGAYQPDRYFQRSGPAVTAHLEWQSGSMSGEDLERLVFNGGSSASFNRAPAQLFGLYHYVAP